jgi:hypothetical protein
VQPRASARLRRALSKSDSARAAYHKARAIRARGADQVARRISYQNVPLPVALRLAYQVMLGRDPDPGGWEDFLGRLHSGALGREDIAHSIRGSEEFANRPFPPHLLGNSIHAGRCQFIRSLPPARRIVDLGGTHLGHDAGSMVMLGYPYPFEELVIIDLPADDRHAIYRSDERRTEVPTPLGPVRYRYHSMVDLSGFADSSVDLVYSGQSFEHVSQDDGQVVLKEVHRILRPGGHFALDTPNGRVTRMQQHDFIDPDHKVEYTWPQLRELLAGAGFELTRIHGLNWGGPAASEGRFDAAAVARYSGLFADQDNCYILAAVCTKPAG